MSQNKLDEVRLQFIETAGGVTQSLGFGRNLGQIYAHIYFSPTPQSLQDLTTQLGISKGSASMSVRQLEQWGALKKVWVKGERKDYYEARTEFGRILRKVMMDNVGNKMALLDQFLADAETTLQKTKSDTEPSHWRHAHGRVDRLRIFRDRGRRVWESSILKLLTR